jgi:hypothetical protein
MIGTHKRARGAAIVYCAACVLSCCCLRAFQFLWCGVLSQHFIPPQHFAACVLFILRLPPNAPKTAETAFNQILRPTGIRRKKAGSVARAQLILYYLI